MVLYCEIADEDKAMEIAKFCWGELEAASASDLEMHDPRYLRAVHSLRFLREAFRTRINAIDCFRTDLAKFIRNQFLSQQNLLSKKIAVEAVGLLRPEDIEEMLILALEANDRWIDEVTLKSCHYLPNLNLELAHKLRLRLDGNNVYAFMRRRKELLFSLGLSEVFTNLRAFCRWRVVDTYCWCLAILLLTIIKPVLLGLTIPFFILVVIATRNLSTEGERFAASVERHAVWTLVLVFAGTFFVGPSAQTDVPLASRLVAGGALLLAIPWYQIRFHVPWMLKHAKFHFEDVVFSMLGLGMYIPALSLVVYIILNLPSATQLFFVILMVTMIMVPALLYGIGRLVKVLWDYYVVEKLTSSLGTSRYDIAEGFLQLKTPSGRLKFVKFLDARKAKPTGSWPDGRMPYKRDEASTRLAQLEEHWLGLDR